MNYTRLTNLDVDGNLNVDGTLTVGGDPVTPGGGGATVATALLGVGGALVGVVEYTPSEFLDVCMAGPAVVTVNDTESGAKLAALTTSAMCVGGTYTFVIGNTDVEAASANAWESQQ